MTAQTHPTEQLLDFAYQELAPEETRGIELHLQGCEACRRELAQIRGVRQTMSQLSPEGAPAAGLDSLLAYAEQSARRAREEQPRRRRFGLWWMVPAGTVAGLFVLAVLARPKFGEGPDALSGAPQLAYETSRLEKKNVQHFGASEGWEGAPAPAAGKPEAKKEQSTAPRSVALAQATPIASSGQPAAGGAAAKPEHRAVRPAHRMPAKDSADGFADRTSDAKVAAEMRGLGGQGLSAGAGTAGGLFGSARLDSTAKSKAEVVAMAPSEEEGQEPASAGAGPSAELPARKAERSRAAAPMAAPPPPPAGMPAPAEVAGLAPKTAGPAAQPSPSREPPPAAAAPTVAAARATSRAAVAPAQEDVESPGDPRVSELAQLQQQLSHLTGLRRAQALEQICTLEQALGRRAAAEATFRQLSTEFPDSAQTARARARLGAGATNPQ